MNPLTLNMAVWMAFLGRLDRARSADAMTGTANMNRLIVNAGSVSLEITGNDVPEIRL